jgi:NADH-quinone oxidoreductase subunit L
MSLALGLALLCVGAPLAAAALAVVIPPLRARGTPAAALVVASSTAAAVASLVLLRLGPGPGSAASLTVPWMVVQGRALGEVGVRLDGVSVPMLAVVCLVALAVQVYSLAYLRAESPPSYGRYFTYHALFLFSMNTLVLAPELLQAFVGWELVGLLSYLLIGFHVERPSAARAAVKAFWMTKLADMGFLFALLLLFVRTGSFGWDVALPQRTAEAISALLFIAVMGKSAQFPLHVWLPDAMEGPTPVSALLHAATMVAAGVYLVVRVDPLFAQAPLTRDAMLWVGTVTAAFAALLALVQTDLKRVLAYSTCSQLGFMVAALGAGKAFAAFFHLGTHAFFKALLFLAAGSVIHAVHSNELSAMGGLGRRMPVTTTTFAIGALSLAGVPPFAGFASKDSVLASLEGRAGWVPWALLLATAFLTAFYMGRVLVKTFLGRPSAAAAHAHESGPVILGPLVALAVPAVAGGFLGSWLARGLGLEFHLHLGLTPVAAALAALGGLGVARVIYGRGGEAPLAGTVAALDRYGLVDRIWTWLYRSALVPLSNGLRWVDRYLVDGLMNGVGWGTLRAGALVRPLQTGRTRDYLLAVVLGALLLLILGGWR